MSIKLLSVALASIILMTGCETTIPNSLSSILPGPPKEPTSQLTMTEEEIQAAMFNEWVRNGRGFDKKLTQAERDQAWNKLVELSDTHWDWLTLEQLPDIFGQRRIVKTYPGYSIVHFSDACSIYATVSAEKHILIDFKYRGKLGSSCDRFFNRFNHYQSIGKTEADRLAVYKALANYNAKGEREMKKLQADVRVMDEDARQKRETPIMLRTRGLRVCKRDHFDKEYPHYVGFVEDSANGKIKVQVNDYWVYKGIQPGGFRSQIIWDNPNSWRICE